VKKNGQKKEISEFYVVFGAGLHKILINKVGQISPVLGRQTFSAAILLILIANFTIN
jgi:hypothetical protein